MIDYTSNKLDQHLDNIEYAFDNNLNDNGLLDKALEITAPAELQMFLAYVVENHKNGQQKIDAVLGSNQIFVNGDVKPGDWVIYNSQTYFGLRQTNGQVSRVGSDGHAIIDGVSVPISDIVKKIETLSRHIDFETILNAATSGERGSAKLFAQLVESEVVYDNSDGDWYYYNGIYWEKDRTRRIVNTIADELSFQYSYALSMAFRKYPSSPEGESHQVKSLAKAISGLSYRNKLNNIIEMAKSEQSLVIVGDHWGRDPYLLGCSNGIIDLRIGTMRAGDPGDYIRDVCPVLWQGIDYCCPRFEQFMIEIFASDTEKIGFVQRLLGYSLIGQQIDHILPIFCGEDGRNGKSVLLNILRYVLGPYMSPASEEVLLSGKKNPGAATPFLIMLQNKRICYITETNEGDVIDAGTIKLLTGNDAIVARQLYGESFTFKPSHTIFLITNHKPHAPSDDAALWERVLLIEFTQRFVDEPTEPNEHLRDPYLMRKLEREASGILAWLVCGCIEWGKQGLNPPQSVKIATESYRQSEDTLGQFIDECCLMHPDEQVKAKVFYDAYRDWSRESSIKPMSSTAFGKRMKKRFTCNRITNGYFYFGVSVRPAEIDNREAETVKSISDRFSKKYE